MRLNVIPPLDHIIVSDVASHFPVSFAELLCNQAVLALKYNPSTAIQKSI